MKASFHLPSVFVGAGNQVVVLDRLRVFLDSTNGLTMSRSQFGGELASLLNHADPVGVIVNHGLFVTGPEFPTIYPILKIRDGCRLVDYSFDPVRNLVDSVGREIVFSEVVLGSPLYGLAGSITGAYDRGCMFVFGDQFEGECHLRWDLVQAMRMVVELGLSCFEESPAIVVKFPTQKPWSFLILPKNI